MSFINTYSVKELDIIQQRMYKDAHQALTQIYTSDDSANILEDEMKLTLSELSKLKYESTLEVATLENNAAPHFSITLIIKKEQHDIGYYRYIQTSEFEFVDEFLVIY